jgi:D-alanyl-D-alanine carboxypeptidase
VSTGAQPLPHRARRFPRWVPWVLAALIVGVGAAVAVNRFAFSEETQASRPELQSVLDGLALGPSRIAPGATAYVSGPGGTWLGSAGVANVQTGESMQPDARMRLESNSKTWATAVVLQLARERKLTLQDTVEQWLPGLLPYGNRITIRQLMTDTSGLTDDNDVTRSPGAFATMIGRVQDPRLRSQLLRTAERSQADPAGEFSPMLLIRLAAWQPLLFRPGTRYHHSNTGWDIAGLIAAKAGGKPLPELYRERIIQPLGLEHTAYDPQGPISGAHAQGYKLTTTERLVDATAWHGGKGADGALVTNAEDEATFLKAMTSDKLGIRQQVLAFFGTAGSDAVCPGNAYSGSGAGDGYRTYVYYDHTGDRVAVLMLNGRREITAATEPRAEAAIRRLFCAT